MKRQKGKNVIKNEDVERYLISEIKVPFYMIKALKCLAIVFIIILYENCNNEIGVWLITILFIANLFLFPFSLKSPNIYIFESIRKWLQKEENYIEEENYACEKCDYYEDYIEYHLSFQLKRIGILYVLYVVFIIFYKIYIIFWNRKRHLFLEVFYYFL